MTTSYHPVLAAAVASILIGAALTMDSGGGAPAAAARPVRHLRRRDAMRRRAPRHARAVRPVQQSAISDHTGVRRAAQDAFCVNTLCVIDRI
jgi:hypothetical protein